MAADVLAPSIIRTSAVIFSIDHVGDKQSLVMHEEGFGNTANA